MLRRVALNLKIAWRSLTQFKLRTALAVFGVFLGTFSLILVSNLSQSLTRKTELEIARLGKNLLIVQSGRVRRFGSRTRLFSGANNLTLQDATAILKSLSFVREISAAATETFPVRYGSMVLPSVLVTGAQANYPRVRSLFPDQGRFYSAEEDALARKMVVLGSKVASKLFHGADALGRYVLIRRVPCVVVGVMAAKGSDVSGVDQDNQVFMPLNTLLKRFLERTFVGTLYVQVTDQRAMATVKEDLEGLLRRRHRIGPGEKDDFTVIDMKDILSLKTDATRLITVLGRIAASVSFVIGGVGILSIMILMVNERRLEIGIRRAVGCKRRDIVLQFLLESGFISMTGGGIGMVLGSFASFLVFEIFQLPACASMTALFTSFLAALGIGLLAGIYPAQRAVSIQPMDVIRS